MAVWRALGVLLICLVSLTLSADPTCSTGIKHPDRTNPSCCSASCGALCGATNCASSGAANCCGSSIKAANQSCSTFNPPCVVTGANDNAAAPTPMPATTAGRTCAAAGGIQGTDAKACCAAQCGTCGGSGCDVRAGGAASCCTTSIKTENLSCDSNNAPCVINEAGTTQTTSTDRSCAALGGILASNGTSCCPNSCGACGGTGCDSRSGGAANCCSGTISASNIKCSSDYPPCIADATSSAVVENDGSVYMPSSSSAQKRYVRVGLFTEPTPSPITREQQMGAKIFDDRLLFQKIFELNYQQITTTFEEGLQPILNLEFLSDSNEPVLPKILGGAYDYQLKTFAAEVAKGGKEFTIRTLHEYNGDWYPWGLYYKYYNNLQNTLGDLTKCFNRIIGIFRAAGAPVKFQLNINNGNANGDPKTMKELWPGTEGMDSVSISHYNFAYTDQWHQYTQSFYDGFKSAYDQLVELTDLPIWLAETGTTSYNTDKPKWIRDMFHSVAVDFPQVTQFTYFLHNKQQATWLDWDLNKEDDKVAFRDGFYDLRALTTN